MTLLSSKVAISDKDYCQITTDIFQGYANQDFEGKLLWKSIKMKFKNQTKEYQNILDGKTQDTIIRFYIICGIWIEDYNDQSKVLIKLVSAIKYNINLKD